MPKRPKYRDLDDVRLQREQQWAYERHLEHLTYRQMRQVVGLPVESGGLGYDLTEHALAGLVRGYLDRMRDTLNADRDAHVARELADLDAVQNDYTALAAAARHALRKGAAEGGIDLGAAKLLLEANARMEAAGAQRRKLLGLDAPIAAKVDVTHYDGVAEELAAMLAENDRPSKRKAKR